MHKNESKHREIGPVRQNSIQWTVRSVHMCVLHCAQLLRTILRRTDLIIFPLTLQTIITAPILSIWEKGGNATRALIANPPNNAQLRGIHYHSPKLHPGRCNSVGMRLRADRQTHRRVWPQYISRRLRLTQNVIITAAHMYYACSQALKPCNNTRMSGRKFWKRKLIRILFNNKKSILLIPAFRLTDKDLPGWLLSRHCEFLWLFARCVTHIMCDITVGATSSLQMSV